MKSGQVNVDLVFSALMFFIFLVVIISMVLRTTNPFMTTVSQDISEKERSILVSEIPDEFQSIEGLCSEKIENFGDVGFSYEISLIPLPGWDPKTSKGDVSIIRRDYDIIINTSEAVNLTLKFPESIIEMNREVNATRDYYGNWVYEPRLDNEVLRITAGDQNWFLVTGQENNSVYIVPTPLSDSCEVEEGIAPSYYEFSSLFRTESSVFPVNLEVKVYE